MTPDAASEPDQERELLRWRISKRAFFWRSLTLMVFTMIVCAPILPYAGVWTYLLASALTALFYMWIFDEYQIWYNNRKTVWRLTDRALYIDEPDMFEPLDLPLREIDGFGRLALWSLVIRLPNKQNIILPLVPDLRATKARIAAAREAAS